MLQFLTNKVMAAKQLHNLWNKCDGCGRIIPYSDFESGVAIHHMVMPDTDFSSEEWETLCGDHYNLHKKEEGESKNDKT